MLKTTMAVWLLALSGAALADGVPLITPGPALAANDKARQLQATKMPDFVKVHPVALNKGAFGANVLTVVVEGKEYRFVGAMQPAMPPQPKAVTEKRVETSSWYGREPGGGTLTLTKAIETGQVIGYMTLLPARGFNIMAPPGGSVVLVETDRNLRPPLVYATPASGVALAPSMPASGAPK